MTFLSDSFPHFLVASLQLITGFPCLPNPTLTPNYAFFSVLELFSPLYLGKEIKSVLLPECVHHRYLYFYSYLLIMMFLLFKVQLFGIVST